MNAICQDPAIKTNTGIKRRINKVDTPEYPPSPLRFRVTEDNTTKDRRGEASVPDVMQKVCTPQGWKGPIAALTDCRKPL